MVELKLTSIVCLVVAVDGLRALPRAPLRHPAAVHAPRARRIALCTTEDEIEDLRPSRYLDRREFKDDD